MTAPAIDRATGYARDVIAGRIVAGRLVRLACERHLRDLDEGPARGLRWDAAEAARVIGFIERFCRLGHGDESRPFLLEPWQCFIVGSLFGWKGDDGFRRFRLAYIEAAKGNGKALAVDTPIPTPDGWKTMGDLRPGDTVFGEDGHPCNVTAVTGIMDGHPCYRLRFSDGAEIVADRDHLWQTTPLRTGGKVGPKPASEPRRGQPSIRTTGEIAATLTVPPSSSSHPQAKWNHRVTVAGSLRLPDAVLPIDPYILGAWLGDGDSDCARITIGDADSVEMILNLEMAGCGVGERKGKAGAAAGRYRLGSGMDSLQSMLRKMGLLRNKHIPASYLRASVAQREALLQGLMDTDGFISLRQGQCEFTTVSPVLRDGMLELLRSLGYKPTVITGRATIRGVDHGEKYRVQFSPHSGQRVFRLTRKQSRVKPAPKSRRLSTGRMIVGCDPVESVPVKCISVDSPSRLYLAGKGMVPTHNSPLLGAIGIVMLVADGEQQAEVYAAATKREQAAILFRDAVAMARNSPDLAKRLEFSGAVGKEWNIAFHRSGSFFRIVSSDKKQSGPRVHCGLIDEIHEHDSPHCVDMMRAGTKGRRQALVVEITNSGHDRESVCWKHHQYSADILRGTLANDAWFGYVCHLDACAKHEAEGHAQPVEGCPDCDDWRDETCWPKANPNLGVSVTAKYLREQVAEAEGMPSKRNVVLRLNHCVWTQAETRWLSAEVWARGDGPLDREAMRGMRCYGGLDVASTTDIAAFVRYYPGWPSAGRGALVCRFWIPEAAARMREQMDGIPYSQWAREGWITLTDGEVIDHDLIEQAIKEAHDEGGMGEVAFDPWNAAQLCTHLQGYGVRMVEFRQNLLAMNEPCKLLEADIKEGKLAHGDDPVMRWMAGNVAVYTDPSGNIRPVKPPHAGGRKIDGIVAAVMARGRAMLAPDATGGGVEFWD